MYFRITASAYSLVTHVTANNLYLIFVRHDTSVPSSHLTRWLDFALRLSIRLIVAVSPILTAFGVANLATSSGEKKTMQ